MTKELLHNEMLQYLTSHGVPEKKACRYVDNFLELPKEFGRPIPARHVKILIAIKSRTEFTLTCSENWNGEVESLMKETVKKLGANVEQKMFWTAINTKLEDGRTLINCVAQASTFERTAKKMEEKIDEMTEEEIAEMLKKLEDRVKNLTSGK